MVQTVGSETGKQLAPWLTYSPIIRTVGSETGWVDGFKTGWLETNAVVAFFKTRQRAGSFEAGRLASGGCKSGLNIYITSALLNSCTLLACTQMHLCTNAVSMFGHGRSKCRHVFWVLCTRTPWVLQELDTSYWRAVASQAKDLKQSQLFRSCNLEGWRSSRACSKVTEQNHIFFLKYDSNVVFCEVTGRRVNHGVGLGIEVSCVYKFYGCRSHINKLEELLRKQ